MSRINNITTGLQVFAKYNADAEVSADHDVLMAMGPEKLSDEDAKTLEDSGWFWNDTYGCWQIFV